MSYTLDSDKNSSACLKGYSPTEERNDITACMQAHDSIKRNKYHTRKDTLEACSKKVKTPHQNTASIRAYLLLPVPVKLYDTVRFCDPHINFHLENCSLGL